MNTIHEQIKEVKEKHLDLDCIIYARFDILVSLKLQKLIVFVNS
jgi:hypothetical protein